MRGDPSPQTLITVTQGRNDLPDVSPVGMIVNANVTVPDLGAVHRQKVAEGPLTIAAATAEYLAMTPHQMTLGSNAGTTRRWMTAVSMTIVISREGGLTMQAAEAKDSMTGAEGPVEEGAALASQQSS